MLKKLIRSPAATATSFKSCKRYCCAPIHVDDPGIKINTLPNGVRVATEATKSPLACISLFVEAGPRYEIACNNGISHLIEHLAFKGFNGFKRHELEKELLSTGTSLSSKTCREIQYFSAKCLAEYTPNVTDMLCRIITDLEVYDQKIEEVKYNMCLEMNDAENDPKAVLFDYLHQTAFQGTNLAQSVIGPTRNIQVFNQDFCCQFIGDHYQPYKLCIAASGGVIHDDVLKYAEHCLGNLIVKPVCVSEEGPRRYTGSEIIFRDDSMPFVHVAVAVEAPGYASPDYLPLLIARDIVGSWDRSQGRELRNDSPLARAAATSHLCERYEAFYLPYKDIGLWGVYFVSDKFSVEDMLYNVQNQWMYLCTMLQPSDVQRGSNVTKLASARGRVGVVNSAYDIGMQVMYTCNRKSITTLFHEIDLIDKIIIRTSCDKYIYDKCPAVAAVGPTEALPEYNRIRSGMYWLRL